MQGVLTLQFPKALDTLALDDLTVGRQAQRGDLTVTVVARGRKSVTLQTNRAGDRVYYVRLIGADGQAVAFFGPNITEAPDGAWRFELSPLGPAARAEIVLAREVDQKVYPVTLTPSRSMSSVRPFAFSSRPRRTPRAVSSLLASTPKGAFIERPMGAYAPDEQARNLMDVAAAARAAGLDALLTGDSHGANPAYAATILPLPTVARLMSVTGDDAHRRGPARAVLPPGAAGRADRHARRVRRRTADRDLRAGRPPAAVRRLRHGGDEPRGPPREVVAITRALLAGERVTHRGRHFTLEGATISPLPRVPAEIWLGGTGPASAERAGQMGDAWLTGQNATDEELRRQLDLYRETAREPAARRGRSCAATSTSASPTTRRARSSAPSWPRAIAAGFDQLLVGSAATVVESLRPTQPWASTTPWAPRRGRPELMLRSFERIGRNVMPRIRISSCAQPPARRDAFTGSDAGSLPPLAQATDVLVGMLIRPELPAGAPQGEERIRLGLEAALRRVLSRIPVEQRVVPGRDRRASGRRLRPPPGLMGRVSRAIETPAVRSRLDKHQIAAGVRRAVGHAVQVGVEVHARAQLRGEPLLPGPLDDLGHREVRPVRMLSMKERGR